ncbi:GntR family transcriptional regulator [Ancylobacter sp. MQZ15Z-1]|uniref:GntR family transcriptional regulator n=1 Tax=Ancylobacter mangrovi TaxID=2972472 RepID=A0A9X2T234_9HYPH|nr:GntR family transcriptional regulator [Ancylobacter mangrovi]MCS0495770.1 GntR family transcriptional regulator [Ancylobacter mangrovi]
MMQRRDKTQARHALANLILGLVGTLRLAAGHHMTEEWLAAQLSVSRTPIRAALSLLAQRGVVVARPRQGFFLAVSWDRITRQHALEIPSTPEEAFYSALLRDRLAGDLANSFTQTELARRYKVNRTVMLRALTRMGDEGLVMRNKGQGWHFLPTLDSECALHNSYDFRRMVEPAALRLPGFRADPAVLARLRADHEYALASEAGMNERALFELDSGFHETLVGFGGNPYCMQSVQQQNRLRRLLEYQGYANRRRVRDWVQEHLAIIAALEAGEPARAAELMRAHLDNAVAATPSPAEAGPPAAPDAGRAIASPLVRR